MSPPPGGIYVHVPWCRAICPYCAFAVVRDRGDTPWTAFVDRVLREREQRRAQLPDKPHTVFLGGGTPSRLPATELGRLVRGLGAVDGAEISAEANPEDVDHDWLGAARDAGVTRLSLGVQTFDPARSRLLGRAHLTRDAHAAIDRIAASGFASWSVDLMFALPDQSLADLDADLDALLAHGPPHVSIYGLTFEEGTPFEARRRAGKLAEPPDELWRAQYDRVVERLAHAGLDRYEVSNFARPGHRSRHNTGYWTGAPYLGLGPAAHGLGVAGDRWINHANPDTWLAADDPTAHHEWPTDEQRALDALAAGLRHVAGVDLDRLEAATGHRPGATAIEALARGGLLAAIGPTIHLTPDGFPVADSVIGALARALEPSGSRTGASEARRPP